MAQRKDQPGDERPQDPFVDKLRPDPSQPPQPAITLSGLIGDSDRAGCRRLYFTRELDYYAEFRNEDVVDTSPIPPEQAPLPGLEATRVTLKRDATIDYTRTRTAAAADEFDIDVRFGAARAPAIFDQPQTWEAECPGPTWGECPTSFTCVSCGGTCEITICRGRTCIEVCDTDTCFRTQCGGATCNTCRTACGQATCQPTCQTCQTQCGQATCATCQTACGQATCQTCQTRCGQVTCRTCETRCGGTCNPHVFTCGPNPQCFAP
jgi:hypothetical protein